MDHGISSDYHRILWFHCIDIGFATRVVAVGIISLFTGIIATNHFQNGFFMNWYGNLKGEGYEFHLLIIGMAIALLVSGAGKWSVDYALQKKK